MYQLLQMQCLLFASMETTTDTQSRTAPLNQVNCRLQNTVFQQSPPFSPPWIRVCMPSLIKSAPAEVTCDGVFNRKMLPMQFIFCHPKQMEEGAKSELYSGWVGRSSQDWQCAPQSSDWYWAWCYRIARESLSSSLARLWNFESSV